MDAQGGAAREGLATVFTGERLLSRVQHHVLLQVPLQAVGLLTVRTGERPLAAVTHLQTRAAMLQILSIITTASFITH